MTSRLILRVATLLVVVLAACGGEEATSTSTTTGPTTGGPGTTNGGTGDSEPPTPVGPPGTATVEEGGFPRLRGDTALLMDVRIGSHEGFDRVVLEFDGDASPGYRVGYIDPPVREDFSGRELHVAGDAFLEIRVAPAAGFDPLSDDARETYTGPDRFEPEATDVVREVVRIGDFEGQLAWVVGADRRVPFAVTLVDRPLRLVVDLVEDAEPGNGTGVAPLTNECTFTEGGWEIVVPYPSNWVANDETETATGTVPACRIFDPDAAVPPRVHELTAFGFLLHVDPVDFDDIDGPSPDAVLLEEEDLSVDGRRAVRYEDRLTEDGIRGPAGARVTTYTIDLDGAILVARTHEVADLDYEDNRDVLAAVVDELSLRRST